MESNFVSAITLIISLVTIVGAVIYAVYKILSDFFDFKNVNIRWAEEKDSLTKIIAGLSQENQSSRISSAIMLRRFLNTKISKRFPNLQQEALNIISATLKISPSGVLQKTLADSLAYAVDLSNLDLQKTNLQDAYIGRKDSEDIVLDHTDFYLSDLSYALIDNASGSPIFYYAILFNTQIKNCWFNNASFRGADLAYTTFQNVHLSGADFTNAKNIPLKIEQHLKTDDKGRRIFSSTESISVSSAKIDNVIFFSMPSVMTKAEELLTKDYETYLREKKGMRVFYYIKDDYPQFGQLNQVREKIMVSTGMIAFGFKQTHIQKGIYRPNMKDEEIWENKWLSTPWNEIEIGMGMMKGMPILLVKNPAIEEGIFDEKLSECFVATISTTEDSRELDSNQEMQKWLAKLNA